MPVSHKWFFQDNSKVDSISVDHLRSLARTRQDIQIIDVRLKKDFDKTKVIPGAKWKDPAEVESWAKSFNKSKPVVVYCVHGHKGSQQVVDVLRKSGFAAQRLEGDIEEWKSQNGPVSALID